MQLRAARLSAFLLACGGPAVPATPPPVADAGATVDTAVSYRDVDPSVPADRRAEIHRAQRVGRLLVGFDQPAEAATDIAVAHGARTDVIGYLVLPGSNEVQVLFYVREHPLSVGYRVAFTRDGHAPTGEKLDPPEPASAGEEKLFRARQSVMAKLDHPQQHYDPVVFPGTLIDEPGIVVYLIASPSQLDTAVFGKHYRARTSDDGSQVLEFEALSKGAVEVPLHGAVPPGATTAGLTVTQIVTDYPVETHVFESVVNRVPIFVGTSRGVWKVDGERITFLGK